MDINGIHSDILPSYVRVRRRKSSLCIRSVRSDDNGIILLQQGHRIVDKEQNGDINTKIVRLKILTMIIYYLYYYSTYISQIKCY